MVFQIDDEAVDAIARRIVELLAEQAGDQSGTRLVDAAALAEHLKVDRDWVYAHAEDLGAIRLGSPQGRLRFDREIVRERLAEMPQQDPRPSAGKRGAANAKSKGGSASGAVKSPRTQRRASGTTPARSPRTTTPGR
jgi:hypothetical protein